jgi:2-iminobutanoate/2-iminopropanoate deaminase
MTVRQISTADAPAPAGHYSQAVHGAGQLFISGQLPVGPAGPMQGAEFEAQARQAIGNMLAILVAAGGAPQHLARVTAYIVGVENWPRFNAAYAAMLGEARPARTVVPVAELHHGLLVEIDAIAVLPAATAP